MEHGGLEATVGAMQTFPDEAPLVEACVRTIAQLSQLGLPHRMQIAVVFPAVIAALKRHVAHPGIQTAGADLFQLLTGVCLWVPFRAVAFMPALDARVCNCVQWAFGLRTRRLQLPAVCLSSCLVV